MSTGEDAADHGSADAAERPEQLGRGGRCWLFHQWTPWTVAAGGCCLKKHRTCKRCGEFQYKILFDTHEWDQWQLFEAVDRVGLPGDEIETTKTFQRHRCKVC